MTERLDGRDVIRATEAAVDDDGVEWVTIIKEGTSENNRRYKRSTLERAVEAGVYDNLRMFVDHSDAPPLKRSMRDLVSAITETKLDTSFPDGKARVRGAIKWIDDDWKSKINNAKEHIGVSHDALLRGTRSQKQGRRFEDIDEIVRGNSVDWVIYPSAGGGFENSFVAKEGVEMAEAIDWDAIDEEMLKEKAPELYKTLTAAKESIQEPPPKDEKKPEPKADPAPEISTSLQDQVTSIVTRAMESVKEKEARKDLTHTQIATEVNKSTLPELTKKRVISSFDGAETFDEARVKESIEDAKLEVAAIGGPRIRNMGPTGEGSGKSAHASLGRAHEAVSAAFGLGSSAKNGTKEE